MDRRSGGRSARGRSPSAPLCCSLWVLVALTIPLWAWASPYESVGPRLECPSWSHLLGTDANGRDVFLRTLYGSRDSIPTAAAVIFLTVLIGSTLGAVAGFVGGIVESTIMRICDVVLAFPPIFLAMAVAAALGPGLRNTVLALVLVWWPIYARLLRGQVLSIKQREHVEAAVVRRCHRASGSCAATCCRWPSRR